MIYIKLKLRSGINKQSCHAKQMAVIARAFQIKISE
jgi:hypothetical protein